MEKDQKIVIYQVLPRLFGNANNLCQPGGDIRTNGCGKLADFTSKALGEIRQLGATHVWFTGVIEHATQSDYRRYNIRPDHPAVVKGKAGSPYAIKDYYDIDPDLAKDIPGRVREFENLVNRTHRNGLGVIIDFVPNHVAREYASDSCPSHVASLGEFDRKDRAFDPMNNFYYIPDTPLRGQFDMLSGAPEPYREYPAKATGNDRFDACPGVNDWFETVKLNYGVDYLGGHTCHFVPVPDTWEKMLDILLFWASKGIDGFRCDMAEMVPVEFWEWAVPKVKSRYPGILFIAEVYNPGLYRDYIRRGHFDYLYDKVGLYDTLRAIVCCRESATAITSRWQELDGIKEHMLNFLENHDEQRVASDYFASGNPWKAIPAFVVSACMGTNPVMIYFGQELGERGMDAEGYSGQDGRTTIFDYWSVDTVRRWRNGGKFDGRMMTDDEKRLQALYRRILTLCNTESSIRRGSFFDLMYANRGGWRFNEHRQYVFLRKWGNEVLLGVVNFDPQRVDIAVNVPDHAFECLQIPPMEQCRATDLLTDEPFILGFVPYRATEVSVEGYSARLLKIVLPE